MRGRHRRRSVRDDDDETGKGHGHVAADGAAHSPIAQFEIKDLVPLRLFGFDTSFTNSALFMARLGLISAFLILWMRGRSLLPTCLQSIAELLYEFVANTVRERRPRRQWFFRSCSRSSSRAHLHLGSAWFRARSRSPATRHHCSSGPA